MSGKAMRNNGPTITGNLGTTGCGWDIKGRYAYSYPAIGHIMDIRTGRKPIMGITGKAKDGPDGPATDDCLRTNKCHTILTNVVIIVPKEDCRIA